MQRSYQLRKAIPYQGSCSQKSLTKKLNRPRNNIVEVIEHLPSTDRRAYILNFCTHGAFHMTGICLTAVAKNVEIYFVHVLVISDAVWRGSSLVGPALPYNDVQAFVFRVLFMST